MISEVLPAKQERRRHTFLAASFSMCPQGAKEKALSSDFPFYCVPFRRGKYSLVKQKI